MYKRIRGEMEQYGDTGTWHFHNLGGRREKIAFGKEADADAECQRHCTMHNAQCTMNRQEGRAEQKTKKQEGAAWATCLAYTRAGLRFLLC